MTDRAGERQRFLAAIEQLDHATLKMRVARGGWSALHRQWANQLIKERELKRAEEDRLAAMEASALNRSMAEAARDAADASRRQADEASEANRLAREANDKAHTANTIATVAVIIAVMSAGLTVFVAFVK